MSIDELPQVYIDTEYRDDGKTPILASLYYRPTDTWVDVDLRDAAAAAERLGGLLHAWRDALWFCYSARAEMGTLLQLGLPLGTTQWIDLMVEARQLTLTHPRRKAQSASLLSTLEAFAVPTRGTAAWKLSMVQQILTVTAPSDEMYEGWIDYCRSDIEPLPRLWDLIQEDHRRAGTGFQVRSAILRTDYIKALAYLEHRSRGFPVDTVWLDRIFDNQKLIRKALAEEANARYGGKVFRYNTVKDAYSFYFAGLESYIATLPFPLRWQRTPKGRLRTDSEYLVEFAQENEHFEPLATCMATLSQLKTADLRQFVKGSAPFIRGGSIPYYTVSSRNQPLVREGFILNLPPWMRTLLRPEPGFVILAADWSQQEIFLGAALSGDRALLTALQTGDVYMALAIAAGAAPAGATKKTHPAERQSFKSCQLGIGYGMGLIKLGRRIYFDLLEKGFPISLDEATERAADILRWHKSTFTSYWDFVKWEVDLARERGFIRARDGWTRFADQNSAYTKLQNFPFQANAAVMMREAIKELAPHEEIELVASLHDAIYLYAPEEDAVLHENLLRQAMDRAARRVMQTTKFPWLTVPVEVHPYTHATGYSDERGVAIHKKILALLDSQGV